MELMNKLNNNSYYERFLRKEAQKTIKPKPKSFDDYQINNGTLLLMKDHEYRELEAMTLYHQFSHPEFVTLTAKELMMIKIRPTRMHLGQVNLIYIVVKMLKKTSQSFLQLSRTFPWSIRTMRRVPRKTFLTS